MQTVKLIDRDGHTVRMTKEEIAESLRRSGNPHGTYTLMPQWGLSAVYACEVPNEFLVLQFRASKMPHYKFYQLWHKKFLWWLKMRKTKKVFDSVNDKGLIWKPIPFVLELPWLRLKGKKAVTIEVK